MTAGGAAWRWAPLLAAVALAVAWRGGYTDGARGVVAALAGLAALAAVAAAPDAAARAARHPIVLTLAAMAVLTALTAAWTTGAPSDAARDAAAILALCAVVVAAGSVPAPWAHAGVLLVAAAGSAVSGVAATIATSEPLALNLCGSWRPSGPFEYPPALALVCAGALPVALWAASERRRALAVPGALAAWLLVTTVALTANRTGVGLCALAATACVALAPRGRSVGPVALATIAAAATSAVILHGDLARAGDGARLVALVPAALVVGTALLADGARWSAARASWTVAVGVVALLATGAVVLGDRGSPCGADPSHGRVGLWRAALHTAAQRPVQGFGAGTFLAATRERQLDERPVPTRFAHDLPLQEWGRGRPRRPSRGGRLVRRRRDDAPARDRPAAAQPRRLAARAGGRRLPARQPARLALGADRNRGAVGARGRRPARVARAGRLTSAPSVSRPAARERPGRRRLSRHPCCRPPRRPRSRPGRPRRRTVRRARSRPTTTSR